MAARPCAVAPEVAPVRLHDDAPIVTVRRCVNPTGEECEDATTTKVQQPIASARMKLHGFNSGAEA